MAIGPRWTLSTRTCLPFIQQVYISYIDSIDAYNGMHTAKDLLSNRTEIYSKRLPEIYIQQLLRNVNFMFEALDQSSPTL